jgi:hypothetical protein
LVVWSPAVPGSDVWRLAKMLVMGELVALIATFA